jgi:aryl-alcohol dehydrogenase-like predicted oxidoreductase
VTEPIRASTLRPFVTRAGERLPFIALGFGSTPLGDYLRRLTGEECDASLAVTWHSGMRYFDTAPLQFILAHPLVVSVIPGGQTERETGHNVAGLDDATPSALWQDLKDRSLPHPRAPTPA